MKTIYLILVFTLFSTILYSTIINVPVDQPTIQAGINAAVDADTIQVQPGTYYENINYNGKNIKVASLFLTTQDTTYISQTIIDGNNMDSVVKFESGEDSTAFLSGFTITNGLGSGSHPDYFGGGITCRNSSSPNLENLKIIYNSAYWGGGIYCKNSSPNLLNVSVSYNSSNYGGGGLYFYLNSFPSLVNVKILENSSTSGGGISCECYNNPSLYFENVAISGNSAAFGGGISCMGFFDLSLLNVSVTDNTALYGGGFDCNGPNIFLENVTITDNFAERSGGGINCYETNLIFNYENRCNIHSNQVDSTRGVGSDIFSDEFNQMSVAVDTFTVITPTDYYVTPIDNFAFSILHSIVDSLINTDVYVSVDGDDSNNGISPETPFKTIKHALKRIFSDYSNPNTIHLASGIYSNSTNDETFPIQWSNHVNLSGYSENETILDANGSRGVMEFYSVSDAFISNITLINGSWEYGGICCEYNSSPTLQHVTISDNSAFTGGGILCRYDSNPILKNVTISANSADDGGGIYCEYNSNPSLVNVTITGNSAYSGSGIYSSVSCPSLVNCIIWNDSPQEIDGLVTATYSDIQGGWAGTGNIDEDPLFADPVAGNYHLTENSPCIDAGNPNFPFNPDNTICDMGAYYYHQDQYIIIEQIYPEPDSLTISEGDSINFYIHAIDPDGNQIEYIWELYSEIVSTDSSYIFHTDENSAGTYVVTLEITDNYQPPSRNTLNFEWEVIVEDVVTVQELLPKVTTICQNYPNPFNPVTNINYFLNEDSKVSLNIYNVKGQKVKQLVNEELSVGQHSAIWNGTNENNKSVSSGIYFYKLKTVNFEKMKKMILLK